MDIRIKVKPTFWGSTGTYRTKTAIEQAIHLWSWKKVFNTGAQIAINYEKHNPVYRQIKFKNGKTKSTKLVQHGYWTAHIYYFDKNLPIKVVQKARNFSIIQK